MNSFVGKGWYSYLTKREQKLLHTKDVIVSSSFIPDDILNGVCRSEITNFGKMQANDIKNSCMFRDGTSYSTKFQQELQKYEYIRSKEKQGVNISSNIKTPTISFSNLPQEPNQNVLT